MPIPITQNCTVDAFAVIVDINDFAQTVTAAEEGSTKGEDIADFTRDALQQVIHAIEANEGEVAALMGEAVAPLRGPPLIQRKISGSFGREGIHRYLRLLGIAQTCKFQEKSFLEFLLSGGKDVDAFAVSKKRRSR